MTDQADDVEVLFCDQEVEAGGETVTVREFRYLEGLRAAAVARPILAAMRQCLEQSDEIGLESLDDLIGEHYETWIALIAMSTGRDPEWIAALPDRDGQALSLAFWGVNGPFFTRRLVLGGALRHGLGDMASRLGRSSPSSSAPDTGETTETSGAA